MARDVGVIPSAAFTALTAPATAAYGERSLRHDPMYGLRIPDIALKALSCDKRPDDGGRLSRRSTVCGVRPTCSRCRTPNRAARRSRPGQTTWISAYGDPYCRARATTGRGPVVGAARDLAADLRPYRARMHPRRARAPAHPRTRAPASRRSSESAIL